MTPDELGALLDVMLSKGVMRAKVPIRTDHAAGGAVVQVLEVVFGTPEQVGPVKEADDDLPWNGGDPDDAIRRMNLGSERKG